MARNAPTGRRPNHANLSIEPEGSSRHHTTRGRLYTGRKESFTPFCMAALFRQVVDRPARVNEELCAGRMAPVSLTTRWMLRTIWGVHDAVVVGCDGVARRLLGRAQGIASGGRLRVGALSRSLV